MPTEPDLSEFSEIKSKKVKCRRAACKVGETASKLKDEERAQLLAVVAKDAGEFPGSVVAAWAEKRGLDLTHQAVHFHRVGKCSCND